ncbi:SHOCT domain-containing protein [Paraburkholderia sediminicola]|uniref:SHOCT domain-containing protein n=1 Tax=Paraburkholderia sediminicola TaxID=458836 RepID=UPI0038BC9FB5
MDLYNSTAARTPATVASIASTKTTIFEVSIRIRCVNCCECSRPPAIPVSTTQRREDLADLYKRGLITKEDYDSKRAEILKGS